VDPVPQIPADLAFVTPTAFAAWLNQPALKDNADLKEALGAALEWAQDQVGPLDNDRVTYAIYSEGQALIVPDRRLVELVEILGPSGDAVTVAAGLVDLVNGVITLRPRRREGVYAVTVVTREFGYAVALAVKIVASHLYDLKRPAGGGSVREQVATPVGDRTVWRGYAIPSRALELVAPFRRVA